MGNINPIDVIVTILLIAAVGGAALYIIKAKKRGEKCIGCPHSKKCGGCCSKSSNQEK